MEPAELSKRIEEHNNWFEQKGEGQRLNLEDVDFNDVNLEGVRIVGVGLRRVRFRRCVLRKAILNRAEMSEVLFIDSDLSGAFLDDGIFEHVNFGKSEMIETSISYVRGRHCDFSGANLNSGICARSDFQNTSFSSADLKNANLLRLNLNGGDMRDSVLAGANLTRATFTGVDLRGAVMTGARLLKTGFTKVHVHGIKGPVASLENSWAVDPDFSPTADGSLIQTEADLFRCLREEP